MWCVSHTGPSSHNVRYLAILMTAFGAPPLCVQPASMLIGYIALDFQKSCTSDIIASAIDVGEEDKESRLR